MKKQYSIEKRYSTTENPDKIGRWARIVDFNGVRICWITKDVNGLFFFNDEFNFVTPSGLAQEPTFRIEPDFNQGIENLKERFEAFRNAIR